MANITRIKNNQITDSTITAAKIATNTLTGGLFATNLTLNSNVTILGNLTVANSFAQLNSINTYINDPVVVFNNNYTGSPTYDIGMLINRNLNSLAPYGSVNAAWVWKEADTAFEGIMTTETGTTAGAINNSGFANLKVGNVTANSLTITTGSITASNGITGTPISGSTGYFTTAQATNFSTANAVITGGYVNGLANVQATQATFTNFGTANAVITGGYVNGLANVTATYATITNFGTGNAQITGGTITGLTNLASTTSVATNFSSGNAVITGGYANGLANVTAATSYIVNQNATNGNVSTLVATNFSSGNITGNFTQGSLNGTVPTANVSLYDAFTATTTNATFYPQLADKTAGNGSIFTASTLTHNPSTGNLSATAFVGSGAYLTSLNIGSITGTYPTANVALYEQLTNSTTNATFYVPFYDKATGNAAAYTNTSISVNPSTGVLSATQFSGTGNFTTAVATNFSSGNAVITSGYVNGLANVQATQATFTNFNTGNAVITGGYVNGLANISATQATVTNFGTANAVITGGSLNGTPIGATSSSTATFSTAVATNFSTGNARITGGYADAFPIGANTAATGAFTTLTASGVTTLTSATTATSTSSGALQVTGGTGIGGNLYVGGISVLNGNVTIGGNLIVSGQSVSIGASTLSIVDPIISLNTPADLSPLTVVTTSDIGIKFHYYDSADSHAFLGRAVDTGYLEWYAKGNDTANVFTGTVYGTTKMGGAVFANAKTVGGGLTANTGSFQVYGDGSVSGNLYIGGTLTLSALNNTPIGTTTASYANFTTLSATAFSTANAVITGGYVNGVANVSATQATITNFGTGNAQITGGTITGLTNLASTTSVATNFSTANAQITGGTITGLTNLASTTSVATNFSTGNAVITGGSANLTSVNIGTVNAGTVGNIGANHVGTGTYLTSLAATNVNGTVATANVSLYDSITAYTTNQTFYLQFANVTNGNTTSGATTNINVNPSTGNVYATAFVGSGAYLTNISIGALSGTYPTANVALYENLTNSTTNATFYVPFYDKATGNAAAYTNTSVSVNPSTGTLSATTFSGAISSSMVTTALGFTPYNATNPSGYVTSSGSVNSATYATQASSVSVNSTTSSSTYYPVLVDTTIDGALTEYVDGNGRLKYTPSTGNLTTANLVTTWGANINVGQNTGNGADLYVRGKTDTTLIWARPSTTYDQVLIGNSATASTLVRGAKLQVNTTDSIMIPAGTTAQRPGSTGGTDTAGMIRYNTTTNGFEYYGGSTPGWQSVTSQFTVIATDSFNGDGSTTAFTMAASSTTNGAIVSINGIVQIPTTAYSCSGTTLTFTEAPASGDVVDVRRLTTTQSVLNITSTNGYMAFTVDNSGAYVYTGSGSTAATTYWDTSGGQVSAIGNVSVASANTLTTLDSFSSDSYRTAKYIIQVKNGTKYQSQEVLVVTDGTTATQVTYATVQTSGNLGVVAASQSGTTTTLSFIATNATNVVRIQKDYLAI